MPAGKTYEVISSTTLSSDTASIEFATIPATYTDLKISLIAGQSATLNDSFQIRFNSDTGTNYTSTYMLSDGSTASGSCSNNTNALINFGDLGGVAIESFLDININSYAETNRYKSTLSYYASVQRARVLLNLGLWRDNSAIHTVKLMFTASDNFKSGSVATLYGITAA
jgi:hypothetical protein